MSYDDTACPCGDRKQPQTMLCDACCAHLKDHPAMIRFNSENELPIVRRHSAIMLLTLSRRRKRSAQ